MYLQQLRLSTQAFGAELHDRIRAEGVSNTILTQCAQPQGQWDLQLHRRNQDGLVTWVNTAQYKHTVALTYLIFTQITRYVTWTNLWVTFMLAWVICMWLFARIHLLPRKTPENKTKSAVRVEADGDLARGVELTLQLYRTTQSAHCRVRDLVNSQSESRVLNMCIY